MQSPLAQQGKQARGDVEKRVGAGASKHAAEEGQRRHGLLEAERAIAFLCLPESVPRISCSHDVDSLVRRAELVWFLFASGLDSARVHFTFLGLLSCLSFFCPSFFTPSSLSSPDDVCRHHRAPTARPRHGPRTARPSASAIGVQTRKEPREVAARRYHTKQHASRQTKE